MKLNRAKISTLESITVGNCTIVLTLDTRYKAVGDKYKVAMKYTVNGTRFYFHLGDKCTTLEFDAICKADGRGRAGNKSQNYVDRCRFKDIFNNSENSNICAVCLNLQLKYDTYTAIIVNEFISKNWLFSGHV